MTRQSVRRKLINNKEFDYNKMDQIDEPLYLLFLQISFRNSCTYNQAYRIIQIMGQQCCSEDFADKKTYNYYEQQNIQLKNSIYKQDDDSLTIRNFAPIDRVPKIHPKVKEIQSKLIQFQSPAEFVAPVGVNEPSAYALNNDDLIYAANGQWKDGVPHGKGQLIYKDGSTYNGYFIKGVPSGCGRFISSAGWYYEGELVKQQAEGFGIFIREDIGYKYEGNWEGDLPNGKGKEFWTKHAKSSVYQGEFVGGKKHGYGQYESLDGWVYKGDFSNNEITSSKGLITYKNGETYEGHFLNGQKHGFGTYRWPDRSCFEGWYINDKKQGHGKFRSPDGKVFEGEWKNGKREGQGVLIFNGKKYPGEWKNDQPVSNKLIH